VNESEGNVGQSVNQREEAAEALAAPESGAPSEAALPVATAAPVAGADGADSADAQGRFTGAVFAVAFALAGWAVPGLGHAFLKCWGRALGFFAAVAGLALTGALMHGYIYEMHADDPFARLGFYTQAASGVFYFAARYVESTGPDLSRAAGEFGTRFIAAAGIVNLLSVLDAFEIGRGRRR
jgi:hypothetical protein